MIAASPYPLDLAPIKHLDDEGDEGAALDLEEIRQAVRLDGPPTRAEVEHSLQRSITDAEWRTVRELFPAPVSCISCGAHVVAATGDWLEANGWDVWRGGCRCPQCVAKPRAGRAA